MMYSNIDSREGEPNPSHANVKRRVENRELFHQFRGLSAKTSEL